MITLSQFVAEWSGIGTNPDKNQYGFQCVELANEWLKELGLAMLPWTNAQDFDDKLKWDVADYVWVPNTLANFPTIPGSLVVFEGPGLPFGHIDIYVDGANVNTFRGLDQNWPQGSLPHLVTHTYWNVEGWLVPKVLAGGASSVPISNPVPVPTPIPVPFKTTHAGPAGINVRTAPRTAAPAVANYPAGTELNYVKIVQGDLVGTTDAWYQSAQGRFYWSGATVNPQPRISKPIDPRVFVKVARWPFPGSTLGQIAAKYRLSIIQLLRFPENAKYRWNPNRVNVGDVVRVR